MLYMKVSRVHSECRTVSAGRLDEAMSIVRRIRTLSMS